MFPPAYCHQLPVSTMDRAKKLGEPLKNVESGKTKFK